MVERAKLDALVEAGDVPVSGGAPSVDSIGRWRGGRGRCRLTGAVSAGVQLMRHGMPLFRSSVHSGSGSVRGWGGYRSRQGRAWQAAAIANRWAISLLDGSEWPRLRLVQQR